MLSLRFHGGSAPGPVRSPSRRLLWERGASLGQQGSLGAGAAAQPRPRPPQLPANTGAFPPGASGRSRRCPAGKGPSITNTAAETARASGPEAFGDYSGQERGGAFTLHAAEVGTPSRPWAGAGWTVIDGRTVRCHRPGRGRDRRNRTGTARAPGAAPGWDRRARARPRRLAGGDSPIGRT